MRTLRLLFLGIIFLSFSLNAQQEKLTQRLINELDNVTENDYVKVIFFLQDQVDITSMDKEFYARRASIEERTYTVITTLQELAERTQKDFRQYLSAKELEDKVFTFTPFWITNMIAAEVKPEVVYEAASRSDVMYIDQDALLEWDRPVYREADNRTKNIESVETGIKVINAHLLWEMGITGQGRIVMGIDTGVDVNHPALSYKWRGNHVPADQAWFDPNTGSPTPTDCDDHGTHTMGTMTGRNDATGDTVGVAINAEWIAAKTICSSPHTSNSIAAFQWAINPDGDPETIDDMPDAITNSWWDPNSQADLCGPDNVYYATLNAVEAAGIAVVFSAGNSGPGSQTITAPKNLNTDEVNIWATGAIDGASYAGGNNNPIASFSSRGPSTCGGEGSLLIKPEASAPGVSVRSSVRGTGYGFMSGTSMAAPHVAGAIALLKEYAPTLTGHEIKMALYNTAKDLGTAGEDNNYGTGLIDLYEAFLALGTPDEVPPTVINDLRVEEAASNSYKLVWTAPLDTSNKGVIAYDIRSSDSPISNDTDFDNADQIPFGTPADAGETEVLLMDGLPFDDTKYYAIKSRDIWDNVSAMSNVVEGTTLSAPSMSVAPQQITHTADEGETFSDAINIANDATAPSTLDYEVSLNIHAFPMGVVRAKLTTKVNS
ncbi:MAG: S8 family serine peptidase, partial [Melioribacteraceae bacterium]|nr:S8 family serine peptidase [Melioribacteraceae bacterium]